MSSSPFMTKKQVFILLVFGIFGGFFMGSAATYIFLTRQQDESVVTLGQSSVSANEPSPLSIPGDGVFLLIGDKATQIPQTLKNKPVDLNLVPSTTARKPTIAIQGNTIPVGKLVLRGYKAGFGIDADFSNLGATVKTVFDGSPAQQAGIQPGDLIVKVDGKLPNQPNSYMPGHVDVFGLMEPSIDIELVRGTTSSTLIVPRTYLHPSGPFEDVFSPFAKDLSVTPKGAYVVLTPKEPLEPGVYRLEVPSSEVTRVGSNLFPSSSTQTPSPVPAESTLYYWVFMVSR